MSYYIPARSRHDFDVSITKVTEALKAEGFGVLTEIDVAATLKAKLGVEVPRYRILGACNPGYAHQALQMEPYLGALLPCNVIVRETPAGVEVAAVDPVASLGRVSNRRLAEVAEEVKAKLARAVAAVE